MRQWLSSGVQVALRRWDEVLLLTMLVSVLGMIAYVMWPAPQVEVTLQPYTAPLQAELALTTPNGVTEEANTLTIKKPSRSRSRRAQKPAKPPVLNLNTASQPQLELLPGIGPKMAERIIEYRNTQGAFQRIEQVMDVSGIGPKKFEAMQPYLRI